LRNYPYFRYIRAIGATVLIVITGLLLFIFTACIKKVVDSLDEAEEKILFLSTRVDEKDKLGRAMRDIFRMNADATGIENLTKQPAWRYWHLNLSPDGRRFVFISSLGVDIRVMDADGTNPMLLTNQSGTGEDRSNAWPRWSPDGTQIAFATNREERRKNGYGGLYDAYVMNADGSNPRNVSYTLGEELGMNVAVIGWTPDGQVVFESSTFADGAWEIIVYVVNTDGTGLQRLFDTPGDHSPAWSPDGSKIVFINERDGRRRLYIMNADGSGVQPLTAHDGDDWLPGNRGGTESAFAYNPWSPDGTRIAFDRDALNEWGTYVINADGTGLRRLSSHPTWFNGWSWNGTRIAFTSRRIPNDIYIADAYGSALRNITNSPHDDSDAVWLPRQ
jgi:Tol biopolymer transport system component